MTRLGNMGCPVLSLALLSLMRSRLSPMPARRGSADPAAAPDVQGVASWAASEMTAGQFYDD